MNSVIGLITVVKVVVIAYFEIITAVIRGMMVSTKHINSLSSYHGRDNLTRSDHVLYHRRDEGRDALYGQLY